MSFNRLVLHEQFYLYKTSILLSLQLASLSITLSLKLIIFSIITFFTLNMVKVEKGSCDTVFLKKVFTLFRVQKQLPGVAWPKFLISVLSTRVNCEQFMPCKYVTLLFYIIHTVHGHWSNTQYSTNKCTLTVFLDIIYHNLRKLV
jgi:hypothetical protein